MDRALTLMLVFFGGGIGCVLRLYLDGITINPFTIANITACLLMGVSYAFSCYHIWVTNKFVLSFVNLGLLGGMSTFAPLVMFALNTDMANNWLMSALILLGTLVFFVVVSVIGYIVTAAILQYGLHKPRYMSRLETGRNITIYKVSTLPQFAQMKQLYSELKSLNINLNESQHDPIVGKLLNELRERTLQQMMTLVALNRNYQLNLQKEHCAPVTFNEFTRQARDEWQLLDEKDPTFSEQMDYIRAMRQDIHNILPPFPVTAYTKNAHDSDHMWDVLLNSGDSLQATEFPSAQDATAPAPATAPKTPSNAPVKGFRTRKGSGKKQK